MDGSWPTYSNEEFNVKPDDISIFEQSTGMQYNAVPTYNARKDVPRWSQRFSVSYVTGTHAFKAGMQLDELVFVTEGQAHAPLVASQPVGEARPRPIASSASRASTARS